MSRVAKYLNRHLAGNVFDKLSIREAYMTDRSFLKAVPRFVAIPENVMDLRKIVRFAGQMAERKFRMPVTVRGGGNDKTGAAIGSGMLVSMEKLNRIQEIDVRNRLVRVQAGITLEELNTALSLHGLTIPIAGHRHDTIGGLIANCPTDDYAGKYGGIYQAVQQVEVILPNSDVLHTDVLHTKALNRQMDENSFTGTIYREIDNLLLENEATIEKLSTCPLDSAGYSTISLVRHGKTTDLLPLFFNSQGTLGIISEVILQAEPLPADIQHLIIPCSSVRSAIGFSRFIEDKEPLMLNIYSPKIIRKAAEFGNVLPVLQNLPKSGVIIVAAFSGTARSNRHMAKTIAAAAPPSAQVLIENEENSADFQAFNGVLASYLNDGISGERVPIIDDVRISPDQLPSFLTALRKVEKATNIDLSLFGSFITSNYSVRPEILLDKSEGRRFAVKFLREYSRIIEKHHGSLTGGSPEGATKALVIEIPKKEREMYSAIKEIFDPHNLFNPHIKLGATPKTSIHRLRNGYNRQIIEP